MKTVQIVLLLALASVPAWGSSAKVDSLKRLLEHHATTDKAEVLWNIAYELFDVDNGQAVFYAERAYHEVWKRGDSLQIVKVGTTYGQLLRRVGKVDHSIEVSSRMLPIAKRHNYRKYWKMLLNSLGVAYMFSGDYANGIDMGYQSLLLRQQDGDSNEIAMAMYNIGFIHSKLDEFDESILMTKNAIAIYKNLNNSEEHLIVGYNNLGSAYYDKGDFEGALKQLYIALGLVRKTGIDISAPQILQSAAHCHFASGRIDSARYYGFLAVSLGSEQNNIWASFYGYSVLTRVALETGDMSNAARYLSIADSLAKVGEYPYLRFEIIELKIKVLLATKGSPEVTDLFNSYIDKSDSLVSARNSTLIRRHQISFAQKKNEDRIRAQTNIMESQKEFIQRQWSYVVTVTTLVVIVAILSIALYGAYRRIRLVNGMLDLRIVKRTQELADQRDKLQHYIGEERLINLKIHEELISLSNSLKGLLGLAAIDRKENTQVYLDRAIELTSRIDVLGAKLVERQLSRERME
jgi:tetratricopeptide (TPR) repeat protein